ncbi:MAG TPA: EamA family transporter [Acetobacteraceae bacterium]|nr:EamA family transporter [Acetobacteraceae bacterium]
MSSATITNRATFLSPEAQRRVLFLVLCLVWGMTWLAMKIGTATVPPAFFSGVRWTVAGIVLLSWRFGTGASLRIPPRLWGRVAGVGLLMVTFNASIQLYGLRHVGSGLAAVLTSGLTPVALLAFSVMLGEERFARRQALAIGLGLFGLFVLFGPSALAGAGKSGELGGAGLILVGCLSYCGGSVLIRPALRRVEPQLIAAVTNCFGGFVLLIGALLFEPGARAAAALDWGAAAWGAWLFLLLAGSLGATVIYFMLVRDWGASRTGTYAFVSPVIAVLLGTWTYGERLTALDVTGMVLMLAAAGAALRRGPLRS